VQARPVDKLFPPLLLTRGGYLLHGFLALLLGVALPSSFSSEGGKFGYVHFVSRRADSLLMREAIRCHREGEATKAGVTWAASGCSVKQCAFVPWCLTRLASKSLLLRLLRANLFSFIPPSYHTSKHTDFELSTSPHFTFNALVVECR
jgi:hypothetical protein